MSQRPYSPRRYGRSEHAPIVIDMVDYGGEDFADDYTYSSSHYSTPRHTPGSMHQHMSPRHAASVDGGMMGAGTRHVSPRHSSRQASPRHTAGSVNSAHLSPRQTQSNLSTPSSPRQAVHMHNFAQRRSFMMGGFESRHDDFPKTAQQQQQDVESNRVYRVENNEDAPLDYDDYQIETPLSDGMSENEYRQSPGRPRSFRPVDEVDTRDRPVPRANSSSLRSRASMSRANAYSKKHQDQQMMVDDAPIYGSLGASTSRLGMGSYSNMETTSTRHLQQGATIPVFNRMKRPDESVFTFDTNPDSRDTQSLGPGVMNRPHSEGGTVRESMSVAQESEKKVFYFDIDDLSQRLLNSGDNDLSRRLRKKNAKTARSRIGRNRARRKSKQSVFNLELDTSATGILHGNDHTVATAVDQLGLSRDSSKGGFSRFETRSTASALFVDTSPDMEEFSTVAGTRDPKNRSPGKEHRRNPSMGSPPAESQRAGTLSPDGTMEFDAESVSRDKAAAMPKSVLSPKKEASIRARREIAAKHGSPRNNSHDQPRLREGSITDKRSSKSIAGDGSAELKGISSPRQTSRINSPSSVQEAEMSPRKPRGSGSSEVRVTKVYDEINDRLDHIVKRENDVENRQKAIRAVFEEVQQHVADLRKHKQQGVKSPSSDKEEGIVDLASVGGSTKPKRAVTDDGDDQVSKHPNSNDSSDDDDDDVLTNLSKNDGSHIMPYRSTQNRPKVRSPTIEDMVSKPIPQIAPPSPVVPAMSAVPVQVSQAPMPPVPPRTPSLPTQAMSTPVTDVSNEVIDVDVSSASHSANNGMTNNSDGAGTEGANKEKFLFIDLEDKDEDDDGKNSGANVASGDSTGDIKRHEARPSGYLSSDHSCDDDVVVQEQKSDDDQDSNDLVYVIEEEDGKSVVHVGDKAILEAEPESKRNFTDVDREDPSDDGIEVDNVSISSPKEGRRKEASQSEAHGMESTRKEVAAEDAPQIESRDLLELKSLKSTESRGNEILNCLDDDDDEDGEGNNSSTMGLSSDMNQNVHEDRRDPDGSKHETNDNKDAEQSVGGSKAAIRSSDDTRVRAAGSPKLEGEMLNDTDTEEDDGANVDIDKEFERVVPLDKDDTPAVNYSKEIEETLDRVARQNELEKYEMQKKEENNALSSDESVRRVEEPNHSTLKKPPVTTMTRRDEEEKANALLDTLSNGSLFSSDHNDEPPRARANLSPLDSESNFNESFIELDEDEEEAAAESKRSAKKAQSTEQEVVSLDYDINLGFSAGTNGSSSASDLQEFPMAADQQDGDAASVSSNVSSDISESTSGSLSSDDSSYDSFISIVETEDESDLEYFDEQEGFAENFMSNLVSSTFGWIEKKQEQLVCGFKSGDFDGPSLLRQSMGRQKKAEPTAEEKSRNQKTMKSLRHAVASKYAKGDNPNTTLPMTTSATGDKKKSSHHTKKTSRRAETAIDFVEERSLRRERKTSPLPAGKEIDHSSEDQPSKSSSDKKKGADNSENSDRMQYMADSRKTSLVDRKESADSDDLSGEARIISRSNDKRDNNVQPDEATVLTMQTNGTARTASSSKMKKGASTPKTPSRSAANSSQYNFDILSSDDEECGPSSSVVALKPIAVPDKRAEKEARRSSKAKQTDAALDEGRKKRKDSWLKLMTQNNSSYQGKATTSNTGQQEFNPVPILDVTEVKGKSKRSSSRQAGKSQSKSPGDGAMHDTREASSTLRDRSRSPRRTKPTSAEDAAEKLVKRSSKKSSSKVAKASKKSSSKKNKDASEKKASRTSAAVGTKRSSARSASRKARASDSRRALSPSTMEEALDDSETDGDSANNMTEEEREQARKERRRAAALKRRRKLRERRRAKLEQNLTDDTFG